MKPVGKPDALIGHVRFDERGWETGRRSGVSARAHPRLYNRSREAVVRQVRRLHSSVDVGARANVRLDCAADRSDQCDEVALAHKHQRQTDR